MDIFRGRFDDRGDDGGGGAAATAVAAATWPTAARPRITIFNRIDCPADYRPRADAAAPHVVCKPFLGTYDLDRLLARIYGHAPRADVAYHRADPRLSMEGFSPEKWNTLETDGNGGSTRENGGGGAGSNGAGVAAAATEPAAEAARDNRTLACPRTKKFPCVARDALDDWAYLRSHHPRVVKTRDLYAEAKQRAAAGGSGAAGGGAARGAEGGAAADAQQHATWNAFQNSVLAWSDCFIALQGGASYIAAFFGGQSLVVDFFGRSLAEEEAAAAAAAAADAARRRRPRRGARRQARPRRQARRRLYENQATYDTVLRRLSNQTLRAVTSLEQLLEGLDDWHARGLCGL